jgi:prephenate dehydrogenase
MTQSPSTDVDAPFTSVAIVGLGLIGGSIALGIRERCGPCRLYGVDREGVLAHALGSGAIDHGVRSIADLPDVELIVLAAPVRQNADLLAELTSRTRVSVVTDVGGTKRAIVDAAAALPPALSFVGGHPLGGGERGGFAFARPDLFVHRPWILTPVASTSREALRRVARLAADLGARVTEMSAVDHDRVMAYVSHLPQLVVSALMATVGEATHADGLRLAGRGLVDSTRLASSPSDVWRDICATNADQVAVALDEAIEQLRALRGSLDNGAAIDRVFGSAARWRAELLKERE